MKNEIEYKFTVDEAQLPDLSKFGKAIITQGYLSYDPSIRVRRNVNINAPFENHNGEYAFLTIKGHGSFRRREFEKRIDLNDCFELLNMAQNIIIEKTRYFIPNDKETYWEIDVYQNIFLDMDKIPLIVAELEIPEENYKFSKPVWIKEDVTNNSLYSNANLSKTGYVLRIG